MGRNRHRGGNSTGESTRNRWIPQYANFQDMSSERDFFQQVLGHVDSFLFKNFNKKPENLEIYMKVYKVWANECPLNQSISLPTRSSKIPTSFFEKFKINEKIYLILTSSVEISSGSFILLESKHFGTVSHSSKAALTSILGSQISVADMESYNENFSKLSISLLSKPGKIGF